MFITVSIMAHPKRAQQAKVLANQLKLYPFIDVSITWDQVNVEWHTGERALRRGIGRGDWHVVLQDDAVLTPDFYNNLIGIIEAVPTKTIVSLYTGTVRPFADRVTEAVNKAPDGSWLTHFMLLWGVGIMMPSEHIERVLDFLDDPRYDDTPYDTRIGIAFQRNRLPIYYTMPSLVDHDDDMGSLLDHGGTNSPRVAHRLADGLVDWNQQVINI